MGHWFATSVRAFDEYAFIEQLGAGCSLGREEGRDTEGRDRTARERWLALGSCTGQQCPRPVLTRPVCPTQKPLFLGSRVCVGGPAASWPFQKSTEENFPSLLPGIAKLPAIC